MKEIIKHLPRPRSRDLLEQLRSRFPRSTWTDMESGFRALRIRLPGPGGARAMVSQRVGFLRFEVHGEALAHGPMVKRLPDNGAPDRRALDVYPLSALKEQDVLYCLDGAMGQGAGRAKAADRGATRTDLAAALEVLHGGAFAEATEDGFVHLFYDALQRQRQVRLREEGGYVVLETPVIRGADAAALSQPAQRDQRECMDAFCRWLNLDHGPAFLRTDQEVLIRSVVPRSVGPAERLGQALQRVVRSMRGLHDEFFFPLVGLLDEGTARAVGNQYSQKQLASRHTRRPAPRPGQEPSQQQELTEIVRALAQ